MERDYRGVGFAQKIRAREGARLDRKLIRLEAEILIPTEDEGFHFAISDGALEHPETAVGMDVADATFADFLFDRLDACGDFVQDLLGNPGPFDDTDAEGDLLVDLLEGV